MFRTSFPQEAVGRAHSLIGAYESAQMGLSNLSHAFCAELRPTLDRLGPMGIPYLKALRHDLEQRTRQARKTAPIFIDRLTDPMLDRRLIASRALLDTVRAEAKARGLTL
ncbi:hypothetical protein [Methylorubrum salsuginis]|uniref:Uncharacterized protein n=1 Tax=Methylorubrum salsuginis TaxID=414703 RepID=A0A1I4BD85_9HYPH|nr:hypothetical protein [Methylorubrum salsuginis]SFK66077.1 hypothetical protein SAMN04488125_103132 [Methylorubrum salsuginis]